MTEQFDLDELEADLGRVLAPLFEPPQWHSTSLEDGRVQITYEAADGRLLIATLDLRAPIDGQAVDLHAHDVG